MSQSETSTRQPPTTLSVDSENGRLRSVIIGTADNFDLSAAEIINETQKRTYFSPNPPQRDELKAQIDLYADTLTAQGITVYRPNLLDGVPDQMMTRDIGVVIGEHFLVASMESHTRQEEIDGIRFILDHIPQEKIVIAPRDAVLEGGDIIVDKGFIFVGISQRTTLKGAEFLRHTFPDYRVVPVFLKSVADGEDVLHLDCTFLPVGRDSALIYPDGFQEIPVEISQTYRYIQLDQEEQAQLFTNVLSISPTQVISRKVAARVNAAMEAHGIEVIRLPYDEPPRTGGAFRCCSLPLWREAV